MRNEYFSPEIEVLKFSLQTNVLTGSIPTDVNEDDFTVTKENTIPDW